MARAIATPMTSTGSLYSVRECEVRLQSSGPRHRSTARVARAPAPARRPLVRGTRPRPSFSRLQPRGVRAPGRRHGRPHASPRVASPTPTARPPVRRAAPGPAAHAASGDPVRAAPASPPDGPAPSRSPGDTRCSGLTSCSPSSSNTPFPFSALPLMGAVLFSSVCRAVPRHHAHVPQSHPAITSRTYAPYVRPGVCWVMSSFHGLTLTNATSCRSPSKRRMRH